MRFCTVINCVDGRVQLPVIKYLRQRFNADYVDSITEAGPNLILSEEDKPIAAQGIFDKLEISVNKHHSVGFAIVGHHDCAGNPAPRDKQIKQIRKAVKLIQQEYEDMEIIGLWVDENWEVREIETRA